MKLLGAIGTLIGIFGLAALGCKGPSESDPDGTTSGGGAAGQATGTGGAGMPASGTGGAVVGAGGAVMGAGGAPTMMGGNADAAMGTVMLTISPFPAVPDTHPGLLAGVNAVGQPQTFLIKNTGTAAAVVAVVISNDAMGQFVLTYNGCLSTVAPPQGTCQVELSLKPNSLGPKVGTLTATSGAAMATFALKGTGILAPILVAMPLTHDFGTVAINTLGTPKIFVISNTGMGQSGTFGPAEVAGSSAWKIKEDKCMGMSLAPGQMCTVTANIEPTSIGMKTGTLTLTSPADPPLVVMLMGNVP